jgi:hypothetical protein
MGLWLVARACLALKDLHAAGDKLGERAVEAAGRQQDPDSALAMLREWGQLELDRGDRKAAEQRWKQMLELVLPGNPQRQVGKMVSPRGTDWQSVLHREEPPQKPKSAPVPVVTTQQFEQAARIAALALEHDMVPLSMQAVRQALRGGPPVQVVVEDPRVRRMAPAPTGSGLTGLDNTGSTELVAEPLRRLVGEWRRRQAPAADLYDLLAEAVLPEARPAEVFLYPQPVRFTAGERPQSIARLLVESAMAANSLDALRKRLEARQDQPLAELPARVLLAQTALAARDHGRAKELLKGLGERLQKDTLRNTAELIAHVAWPALSQPDLEASALPVLEGFAK